jgi:tRNA(Ile)-lysidine synthase
MSRSRDDFSPQVLLLSLADLPAHKRLLVGFSGGADSTALLLALHQLANELESSIAAVHFNHGLQDQAKDWQEFCQDFCRQLQIPLQVHTLELTVNPGTSPETMAREARYAVIRQQLTADDIYLTAHHADDQAETVLLNLLRGSGAAGLAGIPRLRRVYRGWLARPLLQVRRAALEHWLKSQDVQWITDTSNLDPAMDRNFLRGHIIPQLEERWPGVVMRLNQSARHLQQRSAAFDELLGRFPACLSADGFTLDLSEFSQVSPALQAEIIRNWTHQRDAPPPPRARLQELLQQLQTAQAGSHAELIWRGWLIRHFNGRLWMHELPGPGACPELHWDDGAHLDLGPSHGKITLSGNREMIPDDAVICSRSAPDSEHQISKHDRKIMKEIMRISGIPDWLRDAIPLLLLGGRLSAIGDWWFSASFKNHLRETHQQYAWQVEDPLLLQVQSVCHNCTVDPDGSLV